MSQGTEAAVTAIALEVKVGFEHGLRNGIQDLRLLLSLDFLPADGIYTRCFHDSVYTKDL